MKKNAVICISWLILIGILCTTCTTGTGQTAPARRELLPQVHASASIDFSGFSGESPIMFHQPQADSADTQGVFTLDNGITGGGLRMSHRGDDDAAVRIDTFGSGMAARSDNYLYFFIDDPDLLNAHTAFMTITYFDDVYGTLTVQYAGVRRNVLWVPIPTGGSKTYITTTIQLTTCDFNGFHVGQGAHFRFTPDAVIQHVAIETGTMPDLPLGDPPPFAGQTAMNNIIGKAIGGLMATHQTTDWREWSSRRNTLPGPGNVHVDMWPVGWDDYRANGATLYDTAFTMPDGSTGQLFNAHDAEHILTHYQWMRDMGIDGSGTLRFFSRILKPVVDTGTSPNQYTRHRDAAEATGRFFFIQYDATGTHGTPRDEIIRTLQLEWVYNVEKKGVVSSPNYAHADGKPVVSIWGIYGLDYTRYTPVDTWIELIRWFRDRGYYIHIGTPDNTFWETGGNRHPRSHEVFSMVDGISPWYAGRDVPGNVLGDTQWLQRGMDFCRNNLRPWAGNRPIDFFPTIWPGFAWINMDMLGGTPNEDPRFAGQFIWNQVRDFLLRDNHHTISGLYMVMLDEYGEATASFKAAADYFDIPLDQYFLTLAADGTWLSNDYYMRLNRAFVQAFKNRGPGAFDIGPLNDYGNSQSVIVEHSLGPVFWRNSFERRMSRIKSDISGVAPIPLPHVSVDVGVPHGQLVGAPNNVTVSGEFTVNRPTLPRGTRADRWVLPSDNLGMVYIPNARSGDSAFRLAGERNAGTGASYNYKIADVRVRVQAGMRLSYWIQAEGLGTNVMVDLLLDNGTYVSASAAAQNTGSPQGGWQQRTLNIPAALNGRYITAVIITYRDSGSAAGNFAALIDDISIER